MSTIQDRVPLLHFVSPRGLCAESVLFTQPRSQGFFFSPGNEVAIHFTLLSSSKPRTLERLLNQNQSYHSSQSQKEKKIQWANQNSK